jgi:tripartite-type tricarboxylate transporter receptor subunit TctC
VEQLYAALAPAGTPREIVRRLNAEIHKAVHSADVKAKLATDGSEVQTSTPEELRTRIVAEIAKWSKVIRTAGIKDE